MGGVPMDYKDWHILKIINDEKSLSKAAKRLFISQPALSLRLKNLEKEFSVPLLIRHAGGVYFTPQGEALLHYADKALVQLEEAKKKIQQMEITTSGKIRLGISSVIAKFKLAPLLKQFRRRYPAIEIELITGSSTLKLPELLRKGKLDIAILRGSPEWSYRTYLLEQEPWCYVSAKEEDFSHLKESPWIQYQASAITGSLKVQYQWWREHHGGSAAPSIIKVDSIEACIEMITYGFGWSLMPKTHVNKQRSLFIKEVTWKSGEPLLWNTTMLCSPFFDDSPVMTLLSHHILREYGKSERSN